MLAVALASASSGAELRRSSGAPGELDGSEAGSVRQQRAQPGKPGDGGAPEARLIGEGVLSTGRYESHPALTPDGRTLYFVRSKPDFSDWRIWTSELDAEGRWQEPVPAWFSDDHPEADPYVTRDGKRIYFISTRPRAEGHTDDLDIWMTSFEDGDWSEPLPLPEPIHSSGQEWFPREAADGSLWFGSDRPGGLGRTDIYRAVRTPDGGYRVENVGAPINSSADEYEACPSPDGTFLVLMASGRADDRGGGDLYLCTAGSGGWSEPRNLGPLVNGPGLEVGPTITFDGAKLLFSSARRTGTWPAGARPDRAGNGLGDLYELPVALVRSVAEKAEGSAPR